MYYQIFETSTFMVLEKEDKDIWCQAGDNPCYPSKQIYMEVLMPVVKRSTHKIPMREDWEIKSIYEFRIV